MTTPNPAVLARHLRRLYPKATIRAVANTSTEQIDRMAKYRNDPVGYARDILHYSPTADQESILRAFPGRVKVNSGHNLGKTSISAVAVNWWFDTRNPSVVITTAPTERDVVDLLWTEVRLQRMRAELPMMFSGPRAPEMFDNPEHWAKGYTARRGESFQGRHRPSMMFIFDESEGIDPIYWQTTGTMFKPSEDHCWLAIGNPITTSSQSYLEDLATNPDGSPKWQLFTLSSLNHPNVLAELEHKPPPIPDAVSLAQVEQWIIDWTTPVHESDVQAGDIEWPPKSGQWIRPGPIFKGRVLGLRPTEGVDTIWSLALWEKACTPRWTPYDCWFRQCGITIGVDSSGFGDDDTAFHVRSGPLSLYHESRNGWSPETSAGRVKQLCQEWSAWYNAQAVDPRVPLKPTDVDVILEFDGGYGVGVWSHRKEYHRWHGVTVGSKSEKFDPNGNKMYANLRAELWFQSAHLANTGQMDLSRLPPDVKNKLRLELLTPFWEPQSDGSRLVEPKRKVKERLPQGRSPDNADSLIISHAPVNSWRVSVMGDNTPTGD